MIINIFLIIILNFIFKIRFTIKRSEIIDDLCSIYYLVSTEKNFWRLTIIIIMTMDEESAICYYQNYSFWEFVAYKTNMRNSCKV